jgi:hydrogenase/urease accessory protein HupE
MSGVGRIRVRILCAAALAIGSTATPGAHALSVSYAQFTIRGGTIEAVVRLPIDDVDLLLRLDTDLDGRISVSEIDRARGRLEAYVAKHLKLRGDGAALSTTFGRLSLWRDPGRFEYLESDSVHTAARAIDAVSIQTDFLVELYRAHKTLGEVQIAGRREQFVFEARRVYEGRAAAAGSRLATLFSFVRLGIEHIFTGYDHVLFLFGLLLVGTGLRNLVAVVTSFTVAHSTTLALATLGVVEPVPWMIEAAIALSIAYIGIENLFVPNPRYRWKITLLFGLVHGFGFATVLRDMHLARTGLALSLFGFNAGVEIGQIAIVSVMYPLLQLVARTPYRLAVTRVASCVITAAGLFWFYQRIP